MIQIGNDLELRIERIVYGGDGLARLDGFVVFVPFVMEGEKVRARIVSQHRGYARAILLECLEPSAARVEPRCPVFGQCGGCVYQHAAIEVQRQWKQAQVRELLLRQAGTDLGVVRETVGGSRSYGYRNRITVTRRGRLIGFHQFQAPNRLVAIDHCPIASPAVNERLQAERNRRTGREGPVSIREPGQGRYFAQTNPEVADLVRHWVHRMAGEAKLLLDLYAGDGFLSRGLTESFEQIVAVERSPAAVREGRKLSPTLHWVCADVAGAAIPVAVEGPETVIVLDPPRTGLDQPVRERLLQWQAARLLYVSCDPATFARDLAHLQTGYHLVEVQPFDMFPQTAGIELAALFHSGKCKF